MEPDSGVIQEVRDAVSALRRKLADIQATEDPDDRLRSLRPVAAGIQRLQARAAELRQGETLRLYRESDLSLAELGHLTGLSKARVHQLVRDLPRKPPHREPAPMPVLPVPVLAEMEIGAEALATALYRLYDANGQLLYVGITDNLKARFDQHKTEKRWWRQVARRTVTWYGSRRDAFRAEDIAIKGEQPLYNVAGGPRRADRQGGGTA